MEWTIYADGTVVCQSVLLPRGNPLELLRLGYELQLPANMDNVAYYGRGPEENYADRKSGMPLGVYKTTAWDSFFPYGRPQDCGNHEDTRWVAGRQGERPAFRFRGRTVRFLRPSVYHHGFDPGKPPRGTAEDDG